MGNNNWVYLQKNDPVYVIAPSSLPQNLDNYLVYLTSISEAVTNLSFTAEIAADLIAPNQDLFSANNLAYRVASFIAALNSACKAIWAIRGGYGAAKLIPFLKDIPAPVQPKLLVGFSDITALHLFVNKFWHWPSLHAPGLNLLIKEHKLSDSAELTAALLKGEISQLEYQQFTPLNQLAKETTEINSEIIGGNLALVQTSLGTIWEINANDKIIFLEDVAEAPYRVDRMLNHLLQAGVFDSVKAVIFGSFTYKNSELMMQVLTQFAMQLLVPVIKTDLFGHLIDSNFPLPLGTNSSIKINDNNITLICQTGGKI